MNTYVNIDELVGQTMASVVNVNNEELTFTTDTGAKYKLFHSQDCYGNVTIEDITGNLDDLVGSPMLMAEEISNEHKENNDSGDSETWAFYKFVTIKGYVTVSWYGTSSGYYSESVDFVRTT
jgi:hypothetical protein